MWGGGLRRWLQPGKVGLIASFHLFFTSYSLPTGTPGAFCVGDPRDPGAQNDIFADSSGVGIGIDVIRDYIHRQVIYFMEIFCSRVISLPSRYNRSSAILDGPNPPPELAPAIIVKVFTISGFARNSISIVHEIDLGLFSGFLLDKSLPLRAVKAEVVHGMNPSRRWRIQDRIGLQFFQPLQFIVRQRVAIDGDGPFDDIIGVKLNKTRCRWACRRFPAFAKGFFFW